MLITGFDLKDRLKLKTVELEELESELSCSCRVFEGDKKRAPVEIMADITRTETEIVALQTAQAKYNTRNDVLFDGEQSTSLAYLVKLDGVYGRAVAKWRQVLEKLAPPTYDDDKWHPAMESKAVFTQIKEIVGIQAKLHSAIGRANAKQLEIDIPA